MFKHLTSLCVLIGLLSSCQGNGLALNHAVRQPNESHDWRQPSAEHLLVLELDDGQVLFELAPDFAPQHVANVQRLVKQRYFDGLAIIRSHDNYVVQWADPNVATEEQRRSIGAAEQQLQAEFYRSRSGIDVTTIESRDAYADHVGFVGGFPVGSDGARVWLTHCYGMLGVARDVATDSGNGSSLYVVTGHAPRHLDRNVTLIGRALIGMQHLSALPRGTGALGFYEDPAQHVPIRSIRLGSEVKDSDLVNIELMRTDSQSFADYVSSRTTRSEDWFADPVGRVGLCNLSVPLRPAE